MVIKCAISIKGFITEDVSCRLRLFAKLRHSFCTRLNERVQFLCGLAKDGHCDSIALGFVFHFAKGIYDFPINSIAVTHIAFSIINGNTELVISLGHFVHFRCYGLRCRSNIGLCRCEVDLCLLKSNSRLLYISGCITAFRKSRVVSILCVCQFALRLLKCHRSFLRLFGISAILFNGCVVGNLCGFNAIHSIFHRSISLGNGCTTSLYGFIVGNLCLFKVKLCRLRLCLCFCEFFHIHRGFASNIGNGSHRFDVLSHRFCECFGRYVNKLGGIHILLELVGCDTRLSSGCNDTIGIGGTFGRHIHKGFSCSNGCG